jgi:hypothetical protein
MVMIMAILDVVIVDGMVNVRRVDISLAFSL